MKRPNWVMKLSQVPGVGTPRDRGNRKHAEDENQTPQFYAGPLTTKHKQA